MILSEMLDRFTKKEEEIIQSFTEKKKFFNHSKVTIDRIKLRTEEAVNRASVAYSQLDDVILNSKKYLG